MTPAMTVESQLAQAYRDMAAGDLESLIGLYSPDAIIQSAGERPVIGTAAIRGFWRATFERYRVQLVPEIQEVTDVGDSVVIRGRASGVLAPRDASPSVPVDSWFLQVYRKQSDGTLRFWRGANGPNAVEAR